MRIVKCKMQGAVLKLLVFSVLIFNFALVPSAAAQTGGALTIEKSVIAAGGGTIAGGAFTVESTIGQAAAGNGAGGEFTVFGGFVTPPNFAPTAAATTVSGRARMENGRGIRSVRVTLTAASGESRTVLTGTFGTYRFENVPVGETYVVTAAAKRFFFINPAQVLNVNEEINSLDFIGYQQW